MAKRHSYKSPISRKVEKLKNTAKVKIFFCFSDEMQNDVEKLRNVIMDKQDLFKNLDISLCYWKNEKIFQVHPKEPDFQDMLNMSILESDYVVFLMKNTPGPHTIEEFKICVNNEITHNKVLKPKVILGVAYRRKALDNLCIDIPEIQRVRAHIYKDIETIALEVITELVLKDKDYICSISKLREQHAYEGGLIPELLPKVLVDELQRIGLSKVQKATKNRLLREGKQIHSKHLNKLPMKNTVK